MRYKAQVFNPEHQRLIEVGQAGPGQRFLPRRDSFLTPAEHAVDHHRVDFLQRSVRIAMTVLERDARLLLLGMLAEIEQFAEIPDEVFGTGHSFLVGMCRFGVPFSPSAWVGKPLPSARRMSFSRAARRLASNGQVIRVTDRSRDRVRYLVPTPEGLERALQFAGVQADRQAVQEGLQRTRWGRPLAKHLGGK